MLQIRPLTDAGSLTDLTALLHRAYAGQAELGWNYTAATQAVEVTAQRIQGGACFVATLDEAIVGTIVVHATHAKNDCEYFTRPGVATAHQFGVEPGLHGKGIGRSLLKQAEQHAVLGGYRELAIDTAEQAAHLIALYAGLGYRQVGWVQWPGKVYRSVAMSKLLAGDHSPAGNDNAPLPR